MIALKGHAVGRKGFTLLELILVMIILCTVLGMAAPSLRGFFSSRQLNDLSERIVVMTRYAKVQSIFESRVHRVNIDPIKRRCWISIQSENEFERLENSFGNYLQIPSEIEMVFEDVQSENGIYYFEFSPEGYSRQSRLRLEDNRENILEIVCYSPSENFEVVDEREAEKYYN